MTIVNHEETKNTKSLFSKNTFVTFVTFVVWKRFPHSLPWRVGKILGTELKFRAQFRVKILEGHGQLEFDALAGNRFF